MQDSIEQAAREYRPMPQEIRRHASAANWDLYFGPLGRDHWRDEEGEDAPSYDFCESMGIVCDWLEDNAGFYVLDDCGCACDSEPEGEWYDPDTDTYGDRAEDKPGAVWFEPEPYWEIGPAELAEAFGYQELYRTHCTT